MELSNLIIFTVFGHRSAVLGGTCIRGSTCIRTTLYSAIPAQLLVASGIGTRRRMGYYECSRWQAEQIQYIARS